MISVLCRCGNSTLIGPNVTSIQPSLIPGLFRVWAVCDSCHRPVRKLVSREVAEQISTAFTLALVDRAFSLAGPITADEVDAFAHQLEDIGDDVMAALESEGSHG